MERPLVVDALVPFKKGGPMRLTAASIFAKRGTPTA